MNRKTNPGACALAVVLPTVLLATTARGEPVALPLMTGRVLHGHKGAVWSVSWSPNGQQLASVGDTDRTIRLWTPATGRQSKQIAAPKGVIRSLKWTPRGLLAILDRDRDVTVWDAITRKTVTRLPEFAGSWFSWDKQGRRLAAWGEGSGVWDLVAGKFLSLFGEVVAGAALSPDGTRMALVSSEGNVRITDAATGRGLRVLHLIEGWDFGHSPRPAAWSPDGQRVAAATFRTPEPDDVVRVWDVASGRELFTHPDLAGATEGDLISIAWSPDRKRIAYSRDRHPQVSLWELSTGRVQVLSTGDIPVSLAFSPDGRHIAAGCLKGSVVLWKVGS